MKSKLILVFSFLICDVACAEQESFVIKRNDFYIQQGDIKQRHSPCSTFKIPLSLIAYHENVLIDCVSPVFPYDARYNVTREACRCSCAPHGWMRNCCVWYSQILTHILGVDTIKAYLALFQYGNQDMSGGLDEAWLCNSLQISVQEQVVFLERFLNGQLPLDSKAYKYTRELLCIGDFDQKYVLYGRTGNGLAINPDGSLDENCQTGWFVGWLEKDESKTIIVYYMEDSQPEVVSAGIRAKHNALSKLTVH